MVIVITFKLTQSDLIQRWTLYTLKMYVAKYLKMKMKSQNDNWALWQATNNQTTFSSFSNENYFVSKQHFRTDFSFRGLNTNNNNNFLKRIPMSQFLFGQDSPFFNQIIGKNFWQKDRQQNDDDKFKLSFWIAK